MTLFLNRFVQHVSGIYALCCVFSIKESFVSKIVNIYVIVNHSIGDEYLLLLTCFYDFV